MSTTPIRPEDLEQLGNGSNTSSSASQTQEGFFEQGLIDADDLIQQPKSTDGSQKSAWKLGSKWLVGGGVGLVLALIAFFILSAFGGIFSARERGDETADSEGPSELEKLQAERDRARLEADRASARLAFQQQSQSRIIEPAEATEVPESEAAPEPVPVAQEPVPIPRTPAPAPVRTPPRPAPAPSRPAPAPSRPAPAPAPQVDPAQRWQELASGGVTVAAAPLEVAQAAMPPELPSANATGEPVRLEVEKLVTPGVEGIVNGRPSEPAAPPAPPTVILPGTTASAVQTQPVIYDTATDSAYSPSLVSLSEPLLDNAGVEILPAGTQLVVEVANVSALSSKRALVKQWAVQAVITQEDGSRRLMDLPTETISVVGAEKDDGQLIAKSVSSNGGGFGRTLAIAALGAAREVGRVINRPESQTITNGSFGSTVSTTNGDEDVLAAALSGAADPLIDNLQNGLRSERSRRDPVFFIPADTPVTVTLEKSWQPNA